jgi:RNA polymerase sigma-70 factor (ECF subfamily)
MTVIEASMIDKKRAYEEFLVAEARLGQRAAAEALVAHRGPRLLVHATRLLGNRDEAQDAVQEAWIEIFAGLKSLRSDAAFPVWALRIVSRRCAKLIRTKQRDRTIATDCTPEATDHTPSEARDLARAIAGLPRPQAATIALFYLEDLTLAEVAIALDVPIGTVKSRLSQARKTLKSTLEGDTDV